jgi:hypothetical protein
MSDNEKGTQGNLEFFNSSILKPTLQDLPFRRMRERSIVVDFAAIEAVHWARLGATIGYFDRKNVLELISSSEEVFTAWLSLQRSKALSIEDGWSKVIRLGDGDHPELNKELFLPAAEISSRTRDMVEKTFQNFLLLTAENILDPNSNYFLQAIGWTDDARWNDRSSGKARLSAGVQRLSLGFANVLGYWREMQSCSFLAWSREFGPDDPSDAFLYDPTLEEEIAFQSAPTPGGTAAYLVEEARAIMKPRFNLQGAEIVDRYFTLAADFINLAKDGTPAWLDGRLAVFNELISLITYAGGALVPGRGAQLWRAFTKRTESSGALDVTPQKRLWPEPPKEFL